MDPKCRLHSLTLPSTLRGRQCYFHFTGSEGEVEEEWSGCSWNHASQKDSMRQEMHPGSSPTTNFHPSLHPTLVNEADPAFRFILFFKKLAAFLRHNEIQCASDKSRQLLNSKHDITHCHLPQSSNRPTSLFLIPGILYIFFICLFLHRS